MKYLVIGAGGTGGCIGAFMDRAGKDVTLIARGAHYRRMRKEGLCVETADYGTFYVPVQTMDMALYEESGQHPDVIFVCVKGYSLEETIPFIRKVAHENTIVIPILNIYGTGGRMQKELPNLLVTDGCIYIAAQIKEPGTIQMNGSIFRVVYGTREPLNISGAAQSGEVQLSEAKQNQYAILKQVEQDLAESGITPVFSENIQRDALQKFAYVSPAAACGEYYDCKADKMQIPGRERDTFAALIHEIDVLAHAMEIQFEVDIVETNLKILDALAPDASTSMQRDIWAGKQSEIDGLVYEVVRMGEQYGVDLPTYKMIAEELMRRGLR